ncbi:hypothetical protein ES18_00810 [Rothia aeria]|nr:hypothetical protein ES18_00810 [Rothia aeria]
MINHKRTGIRYRGIFNTLGIFFKIIRVRVFLRIPTAYLIYPCTIFDIIKPYIMFYFFLKKK